MVVIAFVSLLFLCGIINTEARHHRLRHHRGPKNTISIPPTGAPVYSPPASSNSNSTNHSSPLPSPAPSNSPSYSLFNVLAYGAVGNGVSDDTEAFKMVWDSACQEMNPSMILAPQGYSFLLKSTMFVGPCQNNLIFQVRRLTNVMCFYLTFLGVGFCYTL